VLQVQVVPWQPCHRRYATGANSVRGQLDLPERDELPVEWAQGTTCTCSTGPVHCSIVTAIFLGGSHWIACKSRGIAEGRDVAAFCKLEAGLVHACRRLDGEDELKIDFSLGAAGRRSSAARLTACESASQKNCPARGGQTMSPRYASASRPKRLRDRPLNAQQHVTALYYGHTMDKRTCKKPASRSIRFVHGETDLEPRAAIRADRISPLNATGRSQAERTAGAWRRRWRSRRRARLRLKPVLRASETMDNPSAVMRLERECLPHRRAAASR